MEKYSCFFCPVTSDYKEKELSDKCPACGREYGFPLFNKPKKIGNIEIIDAIDRGFYGATYVGKISPFGGVEIKKVVKIIPVELYKLHGKDFRKECEEHLKLSMNSNHIVDIDINIFFEETDIEFSNGEKLNCHVMGMEYIEGITLKKYINSQEGVSSRTIAQIAIDLITILNELKLNKTYHNDLHPGNLLIEELSEQRKRTTEVDENIRVVAIDLGSLEQKTKSNDENNRIGDLHWVAECLGKLSRKITDNPGSDEKDWRFAFLLEEKADYLKPSITALKQIQYTDLINQIKDSFYQQSNPWEENLKLKSFDDSVNAQSLRPWFIPNLFVDENSWINSITTNGPQVITGMRGCGKTMLLRSLEFHARITPREKENKEIETKEEIIKRISSNENYVGLYVSCVKLLDYNAHNFEEKLDIFEPYSKLFIAYATQAIQAIKHLKYTNRSLVRNDYYVEFGKSLSTLISNSDELTNISGEYDLEKILKKYLNSLSDGNSDYIVKIHPKLAFPQLANSIKISSELFSKSYIYFLLDDVSTRYLSDRNILNLVSELLFQDENCAFKFTTEAQTLEMVINVPGNNKQAKIGRDYTVFDLGSEVNRIIHDNHHEGKDFIDKILTKRAKYYPLHPSVETYPIKYILGDKLLVDIAKHIIKEAKASDKKDIYTGLSALTAVCVGDLGDVITLYELMLKRNTKQLYPIPADIQNKCFLELSNSRLYDLNRKNSEFLDFVTAFADASHHLLLQSAVRKTKSNEIKLRQYTSIFINISYGDKEKQYRKIRDLIDAGIFNFYGGPEASRTNRQGFKPEQQFKLVFRKLYGVSKHIGLSNADRFELSGEELYNWLFNPKDGENILLRNLNSIKKEELLDKIEDAGIEIIKSNVNQSNLINFPVEISENSKELPNYEFILNKTPQIKEINELPSIVNFENIIIGLGFEESTLESAKKLAKLPPCNLIFIEFDEQGKSEEIKRVFKEKGFNTDNVIKYDDFPLFLETLKGLTICDITGLPKSLIFKSIREILIKSKEIYLINTEPEISYPLDEDIIKVFDTIDKDKYPIEFLKAVSDLYKGEQEPYSITHLLPDYPNISDPRVLFSFAPIKHERLYTLLNERIYEKISIVIPDDNTPKSELSRYSVNFSLTGHNNAVTHSLPLDDLDALLQLLAKEYYNSFLLNDLPFELGLTGSKLQTVCVAAFSSVFKISQCWYIKPKKWDKLKFSTGHRKTSYYYITK